MTADQMSQPVKVDAKGDLVAVDPVSGLVRVDGLVVFRLLISQQDGRLVLQFYDGNKLRCDCLHRRFIEIPLDSLIERLEANV